MINTFNKVSKVSKWFAHALVIQLFLLSLSFPVLVSWGIGFSPLIFLGNIIFTPFLTIFLAFSCILYVLEFCSIPSDYICYMLDAITNGWMVLMSLAPVIPMIGCPQAPFWALLAMPLGSVAIVTYYGVKSGIVKSLFFLTLWVSIVFCGTKWFFTSSDKEVTIACGTRTVTLRIKEKKIILIDSQSALSGGACSNAWINYSLSSELIKNFGATTIDAIVVPKVTPTMSGRLKALCKRYYCTHIFNLQGLQLQI